MPQQGGGGGQPALTFASDWPVTGTDNTAVGDNGKWAVTGGVDGSDHRAVIASTGLDFPTTNVLALRCRDAVDWGVTGPGAGGAGLWPELANGEDYYIRYYWRMGVSGPTDGGSGNHMWGTRSSLDAISMDYNAPNGSGTEAMTFFFGTSYDLDINENRRWVPDAVITRNTTYRTEIHIHRVSSSVYNLSLRLYNSAGTKIADSADGDFVDTVAPGGPYTLADNTAMPAETDEWPKMTGFQFAVQGNWENTDNNNNRVYGGGFGFNQTDWCGPYQAGEAD